MSTLRHTNHTPSLQGEWSDWHAQQPMSSVQLGSTRGQAQAPFTQTPAAHAVNGSSSKFPRSTVRIEELDEDDPWVAQPLSSPSRQASTRSPTPSPGFFYRSPSPAPAAMRQSGAGPQPLNTNHTVNPLPKAASGSSSHGSSRAKHTAPLQPGSLAGTQATRQPQPSTSPGAKPQGRAQPAASGSTPHITRGRLSPPSPHAHGGAAPAPTTAALPLAPAVMLRNSPAASHTSSVTQPKVMPSLRALNKLMESLALKKAPNDPQIKMIYEIARAVSQYDPHNTAPFRPNITQHSPNSCPQTTPYLAFLMPTAGASNHTNKPVFIEDKDSIRKVFKNSADSKTFIADKIAGPNQTLPTPNDTKPIEDNEIAVTFLPTGNYFTETLSANQYSLSFEKMKTGFTTTTDGTQMFDQNTLEDADQACKAQLAKFPNSTIFITGKSENAVRAFVLACEAKGYHYKNCSEHNFSPTANAVKAARDVLVTDPATAITQAYVKLSAPQPAQPNPQQPALPAAPSLKRRNSHS
jgi:hypothetical protein